MTLALHRQNVVQLSEDENEDEDDDSETNDQNKNQNSVLTDIAEQFSNSSNNQSSNTITEINSNDNPPHLPGQYENQTWVALALTKFSTESRFSSETEHSGQCSSRCEDEDDSEVDDSDNKEAAHSDAENDDQNNSTVSRRCSSPSTQQRTRRLSL